MARERVPCLLPPRPAVALRAPEPRLRVDDLRVRGIRELAPDAAGVDDADREPCDREHESGDAGHAFDADSSLARDLSMLEELRRARRGARPGEQDEGEDPTVV